ncbi:MAG: DUF523 domain-containing protein [Dehalococcoidia bacterium]|nr:DUF523 domain-containing protein [Dehalococcoidia bacterium]
MKLISACLLGIKCSWDGTDKNSDENAMKLLSNEVLIPVCPEQLGGLNTPRPPQEIQGGNGEGVLDGKCRVKNINGDDVTEEFLKGAKQTLRIARLFKVSQFIGKSRSPSCGCGEIYDGSFSSKRIAGDGVTAALLKGNGIEVISEEDLRE